jgi:uncharacterized oxidoreductase
MPTIAAPALTAFATDLLCAGGLGRQQATLVAQNLVGANLRGYDSHGVMRIPYYLDQVQKGETMPGAQFEVLRETPALLCADAHWGFGPTQAGELLRRLIAKARSGGVGVGTMIHSAHIGRLGEYCETAAAVGLLSLVMANIHGAAQRVAPPGGKAPRLGTNPIAAGIPHGETPLVLDFCTCAVAEGKVRVKRIAGERCPDGWLLDYQGRPTNDPNDLYADPPGTILPFGGTQSYKGFALGLLVEVFAGALSGGVCAREVPINQLGNCVFMMVLDPEHFGGAGHFAAEVSGLVEFVRNCPRIDTAQEILLPGDPERRTLERNISDGITLDEANWSKLVALASQLGVALPQHVPGR